MKLSGRALILSKLCIFMLSLSNLTDRLYFISRVYKIQFTLLFISLDLSSNRVALRFGIWRVTDNYELNMMLKTVKREKSTISNVSV